MVLCETRHFIGLVAIFAGLAAAPGYSLSQAASSSRSSGTRTQSAPPVVTVNASTHKTGVPNAPTDDQPHCFKADPTRDLVFDIHVEGVPRGTATVEIVSADQMQYAGTMSQSQKTSGAVQGMEVDQSQAAIRNHQANVIFKADSQSRAVTKSQSGVHLGPLPPDSPVWHPKPGAYSNVALITISPANKRGSRSGSIYKYVYSYLLWKDNASECSMNQ